MTVLHGSAVAKREAPEAPEPARPEAPTSDSMGFLRYSMRNYSGLYVWALIILVFALWVPSTFLTIGTVQNIAGENAVTAIVALALVLPLAAGVFDLSVAAILGLGSVLVIWLQEMGVNPALAIVIALAAGTVVGACNGFVVVKLRVDSFIATLGMGSLLAGLCYWISGGQILETGISPRFITLGQAQPGGIPSPVFYMVVVAAILWYVTEYTALGRYCYATGSNALAARLVGVRVDRIVFGSLVSSGFLAALAGIVLAASLGSSSYDIGPPYLLPAFSAVFLGSTQVMVGRVNVLGTLIAVFLLATGIKGLQLAGAQSYVSNVFDGAALIIAVALSVRGRRAGEAA